MDDNRHEAEAERAAERHPLPDAYDDDDERYDRASIGEAADRNAEAMRREIGTREGDALIAEAAQPPRTAAATAARIRGRPDRHAAELTGAGFLVVTPEEIAKLPRDEYGCLLMQVDPPRPAGVERHEFSDRATDADAGRLVLPWQYDADGKRLTP